MSAPMLTLDGLRARFAQRPESLLEVVDDIMRRLTASAGMSVAPSLAEAARDLLSRFPDPSDVPLWGMPYVVGSNIDAAGLPTSAGVPGLDFLPDFDAVVVERLRAAGGLLVGKAAVDPLGIDASAIGAANAIAAGLAAFGIATDRTGAASSSAAGRGVVVVKPTPGRISTEGFFAAAPEMDELAILAADVVGSTTVCRVIVGPGEARRGPAVPPRRLGVLGHPCTETQSLADRLKLALVAVDEVPFFEVAALMDEDIWLALRLDDVAVALAETPELFPSHLERRLSRVLDCSASQLVRAQRRLSYFRRRIERNLDSVDLLYVPPESGLAGFLNACGLAAVMLPGGAMLVGAEGSDESLADAAAALERPALSTLPIDILTSSPLAHR